MMRNDYSPADKYIAPVRLLLWLLFVAPYLILRWGWRKLRR